tara:strand:+ start:567 stop:1382 length:816 start_codon:yes stop_codon:yes gene_type:complete
MSESHPVALHYTRGDLAAKILTALAEDGKDLDKLTVNDLAPYDEFHIRGRKATVELARWANLTDSARVLDVGCGLGGPSRYLAATSGCEIIGLDLTHEYVETATMFAERLGLARQVSYRQGDALALPFDAGSFDVAWSQHAAMNIGDKRGLYGEIFRILRPGGKVALYDVCNGPGEDLLFPVPWASDPAISFLIPPIELRDILEATGFRIRYFHDATLEAVAARVAGDERKQPPSGVRLAMGDNWQTKVTNLRKNLEERRVVVVQVMAERG